MARKMYNHGFTYILLYTLAIVFPLEVCHISALDPMSMVNFIH